MQAYVVQCTHTVITMFSTLSFTRRFSRCCSFRCFLLSMLDAYNDNHHGCKLFIFSCCKDFDSRNSLGATAL